VKKFTVHPKARIDKSTVIGPYSIIEDDVEIGAHNKIGSYVTIKKGTVIGNGNSIYSGVQLGIDPQDYHFVGESSKCVIGDNNIIREYTTISKATGKDKKTVIGDNNFIMTYVHIAHNNEIGNNSIISSGAQLGGYVLVDNFANIGGLAGIHQFCHIGKYAMLGAKSYLNKDLLPYFLARGNRAKVYGVNVKGLQRNSFTSEDIANIKDIFRILYHSAYSLTEAIEILKTKKSHNKYIDKIIKFIELSRRGVLLKTM
jgi:UDP-N-acetylglucosamine acyltransferase